MVTSPFQGIRQPDVDHARLYDRIAIAQVDLDDLLHAREHDHYAAADRQASAGQARAGTARQKRHAVLVAQPHDRLHMDRATRENRHVRAVLFDDEAVALVDHQVTVC